MFNTSFNMLFICVNVNNVANCALLQCKVFDKYHVELLKREL